MKLTTQTHRTQHHEDAIGLFAVFLLAAFAMLFATAVAYTLMKMVTKISAVAAAREHRLTNDISRSSEEWIGLSSAVIPPGASDWFEADDGAVIRELNSVQRWELRGAHTLAGPWSHVLSFWGSGEFAREQAWRIAGIEAAVARDHTNKPSMGFVKWVRVE
jgi:hypothetical protein